MVFSQWIRTLEHSWHDLINFYESPHLILRGEVQASVLPASSPIHFLKSRDTELHLWSAGSLGQNTRDNFGSEISAREEQWTNSTRNNWPTEELARTDASPTSFRVQGCSACAVTLWGAGPSVSDCKPAQSVQVGRDLWKDDAAASAASNRADSLGLGAWPPQGRGFRGKRAFAQTLGWWAGRLWSVADVEGPG